MVDSKNGEFPHQPVVVRGEVALRDPDLLDGGFRRRAKEESRPARDHRVVQPVDEQNRGGGDLSQVTGGLELPKVSGREARDSTPQGGIVDVQVGAEEKFQIGAPVVQGHAPEDGVLSRRRDEGRPEADPDQRDARGVHLGLCRQKAGRAPEDSRRPIRRAPDGREAPKHFPGSDLRRDFPGILHRKHRPLHRTGDHHRRPAARFTPREQHHPPPPPVHRPRCRLPEVGVHPVPLRVLETQAVHVLQRVRVDQRAPDQPKRDGPFQRGCTGRGEAEEQDPETAAKT